VTEQADQLLHDNGSAHFTALVEVFFSKASHQPGLSPSLQTRFGSLLLLTSPKAKIAIKREEICECDAYTLHKLSQRRPTADWLAPRDSDCSRMHSKVSSDWLPSYIKATRPLLEIFKMAEYFSDSPRIYIIHRLWNTKLHCHVYERFPSVSLLNYLNILNS